MYSEGFFYNAMKRDLAMVRGDTMSFGFQVQGLAGQRPKDIYFTAKNRIEDEEPVFIVTNNDTIDYEGYDAQSDILTYTVRIPPWKTAELELGRYFYDLKIVLNDDVVTLMIGRLSIEFDVFKHDTPEPPAYENGDADIYPQADIPVLLKKIYTVQKISNIASAIQYANGSTAGYDVVGMSEAIRGLGDTITAQAERIAELEAEIPPFIDDTIFPESEGA